MFLILLNCHATLCYCVQSDSKLFQFQGALGQGFSNFWCYGAHEEIDHNLRSPTRNL